jgi:carboxymethylenebutenolidase
MKTLTINILTLFVFLSVHAQDFALKQLENSPRHQEWIEIKSGNRTIHCFVVYPEKAKNTPAIIVIHENRGLTDWVRSFADQLAGAGYIAIAPDLLSDFSDTKKRTSDFSSDSARNAIYELKQEQVTIDLNAIESYAQKMQSANGKTAVIGFCWGGSQSFRFATNNKNIKAALVFYGGAPDKPDDIKKIVAPVYGFYGENDNRINAGIEPTKKLMTEAGKTYDYKIYTGAGHAYMRQGDDPSCSSETKKAKDDSWERIKQILGGI